jgi:hypothetical protein
MRRPRLPRLKPIVLAAGTLLALLAATEAGLRVYESWTSEDAASGDRHRQLTAPSWSTHHVLKPLKAQKRRHPDTGLPVLLRTNSYGLRGPDVIVPKPPGVYRVLCLGDDATFAAEVLEQETFCHKLEVHLQADSPLQVEVVNAGVPGYCPLLSWLQFRQSLLALQPDAVVLHFGMSDVADDHRYRRHTRMAADGTPMACADENLERKRPEGEGRGWERFLMVRLLKRQAGLLSDSRTRAEDADDIDSPQGCYAWLRDDPPDWPVYVEQAFSPLELLDGACRQVFAEFAVVAVPAPWQVSATASDGPGVREAAGVPSGAVYGNSRPFEQLGDYLARRDVLFFNPAPAFRSAENAETLYLRNSPRFSREGHELYARLLGDFLRERLTSYRASWPSAFGEERRPAGPTTNTVPLPLDGG